MQNQANTSDLSSSVLRVEPREVVRLRAELRQRIDAIARASDGGNKGVQCVSCGEWDREHRPDCDVTFFRELDTVLAAGGEPPPTRFDELRALPENWDSYGAPKIDPRAIEAAKSFLQRMSVVPCSSGGVQLEWHTHGVDLELEFEPGGTVIGFLELASEGGEPSPHKEKD